MTAYFPATPALLPTEPSRLPTNDPEFCRNCYPEFELACDIDHAKEKGVYEAHGFNGRYMVHAAERFPHEGR